MAQRRHRHHYRILDGAQFQPQVDELAGEQRHLVVGEACLGLDGAGLGVDLVVERPKAAFRQRRGAGAVEGGGRQSAALARPCQHVRRLVLRHGKGHVDRRELGDDGDAARVTGADQVAHIHRPQTHPAADGRHHFGVAQVQARHAFGRAVRHHRALQLLDQRRLRIHILARDRVLAQQRAVAVQRQLGVFQLGLVALALAARLQQRHLELARVDLGQHLAGLDHLPFLEQHLLQDARHLRPHSGGGRRRHGAQRVERHRHIGFFGRGNADRGGRAAAPAAGTTGTAGATGSAWTSRTARATRTTGHAGRTARAAGGMGQIPRQAAQRRHHRDRDHATGQPGAPAAPGRGCVTFRCR